jgi:DNA-binding NarL/FixJ family response regulator
MVIERLTNREIEILELIKGGLLDKQIARKLNLSQHTISSHTSSIYKKLKVNNRSHAIAILLSMKR